jgi:hypothetical protein
MTTLHEHRMAAGRRALVPVALVACAWLMTGCDSRTNGDKDGIPIAFSVQLDHPFLDDLGRQQWRPIVDSSSGPAAKGSGAGAAGVSLSLIGGDIGGQDGVFRQEIHQGVTDFEIPLTPGRRLAVAIRSDGAQTGWIPVGTCMVPGLPHSHIAIKVTGYGILLTVSDDQNHEIPQRLQTSTTSTTATPPTATPASPPPPASSAAPLPTSPFSTTPAPAPVK